MLYYEFTYKYARISATSTSILLLLLLFDREMDGQRHQRL